VPPLLASLVAVRYRHSFNAHLAEFLFIGCGVECSIRGYDLRHVCQLLLMRLDSRDQQLGIAWSLGKDLMVGDDLLRGFLGLYELAELIRSIRFALADDLGAQTRSLVCR